MKKITTSIFLAALFISCSLLAQSPILVAETNFKLPILGEEFFYFGFAGGDQVLFSFEEENGKDLKEIEIVEWPGISRYKEFKTGIIQNKTLTVLRTGIYQFRFANNMMLQKTCRLKIQRIASGAATQNFNSTVYWRTVYDTTYRTLQQHTAAEPYKTVSLVPPTTYYLEPNTADSKQQITLPINLPDFTAEWYYVFAVANDKAKAEALKSSLQLAETIRRRIAETGGNNFSADSLPVPAGSANCRVYLLDQSNQQMFESRANFRHFREGTRENIPAGLVKIKIATFPNAFLGIKNPDAQTGIYVAVEAVAVISPDDTEQQAETQSVSVRARREPYLKN
jgi:hypothetical protein